MGQMVFKDNSKAVFAQLEQNSKAALKAMGIAAINAVGKQMQNGYGKPIRKTGALMRDVRVEESDAGDHIRIGNTLEYAVHIHEGTSKIKGRPYIKDGITAKIERIRKVAAQELRKGF